MRGGERQLGSSISSCKRSKHSIIHAVILPRGLPALPNSKPTPPQNQDKRNALEAALRDLAGLTTDDADDVEEADDTEEADDVIPRYRFIHAECSNLELDVIMSSVLLLPP